MEPALDLDGVLGPDVEPALERALDWDRDEETPGGNGGTLGTITFEPQVCSAPIAIFSVPILLFRRCFEEVEDAEDERFLKPSMPPERTSL